MRTARIIGEGASYYHCMSRIIQGQMLLNDSEKERFRKIVRAVAEFAGIEVMTYALMTNHLHLLLMVPTLLLQVLALGKLALLSIEFQD